MYSKSGGSSSVVAATDAVSLINARLVYPSAAQPFDMTSTWLPMAKLAMARRLADGLGGYGLAARLDLLRHPTMSAGGSGAQAQ